MLHQWIQFCTKVSITSFSYWENATEIGYYFTGEELLLRCETGGPGIISQTWHINGYPLSDENVGVVITDGGKRLLITTVDKRDSGEYTCLSKNEYGISQWTAYVQVNCELTPITCF